MEGDRQSATTPAPRHPASADVRARVERFARARAARRALPDVAEILEDTEAREKRAETLRRELGRLSALQSSPDVLQAELARAGTSLDSALDALESDLFARIDRVDFPSLRAHLPRVVETQRREGIALLDVLLGDREGLPSRLGKVEYLVTLLSTEERDGRRQIVHDPVALTPTLARIGEEFSALTSASEIAVEIHQAASLDFDSTNPMRGLVRVRARKEALGLGRFSPEILRAVVTYNARMFNWIAATRDGSRASDAEIGDVLDDLYPGEPVDPVASARDADPNESTTTPSCAAGQDLGVDSAVLGSAELDQIVEAFRHRLLGGRIGTCGPERIALALDETRIDALEREAILATTPTNMQAVVARVAVVGLMLRDRGAIQPELLDLGITQTELSNNWVVELERLLGRLVSRLVAADGQYELAGALSGIKAKHLLAARSAARLEGGVPNVGAASMDASSTRIADGSRLAREAALTLSDGSAQNGRYRANERARSGASALSDLTSMLRRRPVLAIGLVVALIAAGVVLTRQPAGTASTLRNRDLARISQHISSAYRSDRGQGGLLIGRVDASFDRLDPAARSEALVTLTERLGKEGIREAMLYDERGALRVHITNGVVRKPLPPSTPPVARAPTSIAEI